MCAEYAERKAGHNTTQKGEKLMANAIKRAARSMRSHRDNKNFRQFVWNAHQRAEERTKIEIGRMLAEKLKEDKEKKENE